MREVVVPASANNAQAILDALSDFLATAPLNWTLRTITSQVSGIVPTLVMSSPGESGSDFIFFRLEADLNGFRVKTGLHYSRSGAVETIVNDTGYAHEIGQDARGFPSFTFQLNIEVTCQFYADRDFFIMVVRPTGADNGYILYGGRLDSYYQGTMTTLTAPVLATDTALPVNDETPFDAVGYPSNYFVVDPAATGSLKKVRVVSSAPGVLNLDAPVGFAFQTGAQAGEDVQPIFVGIIAPSTGPNSYLHSTMANDLKDGFTADPASRRSIDIQAAAVGSFNQIRDFSHWEIWPTMVRHINAATDHRGSFKGMWYTHGRNFNPIVGPLISVPTPTADYNGKSYDYAGAQGVPIPEFFIEQGAAI